MSLALNGQLSVGVDQVRRVVLWQAVQSEAGGPDVKSMVQKLRIRKLSSYARLSTTLYSFPKGSPDACSSYLLHPVTALAL